MFRDHPDFQQPKDPSIRIWRYMDLSKFLSLLETSSLYFTRSDKFIDPYEGTIPRINNETIATYFTEFGNAEEMKTELMNLFDINRKMTLINCWYQSEYESDAMWQIYSNNGIAIQSTYKRLKDAIARSEDEILIGQVKYIDFDSEGMFYLNALTPFLFKRRSFEHEKELRAVIWHTKTDRPPAKKDDDTRIEIIQHGKLSPVDLDTLIETVYVSPVAPAWFHRLMADILKRYNIHKAVVHSKLYTIDSTLNSTSPEGTSKVTISKEILQHFSKKDSYRVNNETLQRERVRFREYENFLNEIRQLEAEVERSVFTSKTKYMGKDALLQFSRSVFSEKDVRNLLNKTQFKSLYFITGKVDNLIRDVTNATLSDKEKELLLRKTIFFYSENIFQPALFLAQLIEKYDIKDEPLQMFSEFTNNIVQLINEMKV